MAKKGLLLNNIGSPSAPEPKAVGRYLSEFLMDGNVMQIPWWVRVFLVNGVIVPRRRRASAAKYARVWTDKGSPLVSLTEELREKLQMNLGDEWCVQVGMRYGTPSMSEALDALKTQGVDEIVILPMYPQYSQATTGSSLEKATQWSRAGHAVRALPPFFDEEFFIQAWVRDWKPLAADEILVLSYHGLPKSQVKKLCDCLDGATAHSAQCYYAHCLETTKGIQKALGLRDDQIQMSFQSRVGPAKWLGPATQDLLLDLARRGQRKVRVACPSFVTDCLETLEEIGLDLREEFLHAGGSQFELLPCPNAHDSWVEGLAQFVREKSPQAARI